jgi:hypothetical protein
LYVESAAWDFTFGPWAQGIPYATAPVHAYAGRYTWLAWTPGPSAPAVDNYSPITVPTLIGVTEHVVVQKLDALDMPSWVLTTTNAVNYAAHTGDPPDTVVLENPPPGIQEACQCSVALTVTAGGTPITASRHRDGGASDPIQETGPTGTGG